VVTVLCIKRLSYGETAVWVSVLPSPKIYVNIFLLFKQRWRILSNKFMEYVLNIPGNFSFDFTRHSMNDLEKHGISMTVLSYKIGLSIQSSKPSAPLIWSHCYPDLMDFGSKMCSMFGSTYLMWECLLSHEVHKISISLYANRWPSFALTSACCYRDKCRYIYPLVKEKVRPKCWHWKQFCFCQKQMHRILKCIFVT
jgi:hypothetical protein